MEVFFEGFFVVFTFTVHFSHEAHNMKLGEKEHPLLKLMSLSIERQLYFFNY